MLFGLVWLKSTGYFPCSLSGRDLGRQEADDAVALKPATMIR